MSQQQCQMTSSSADRDYRLSLSFPYLVRRVGVRIGELFDLAVAPIGLDVPTYRVLAALHEQSEQRLGELGNRTSIPLPTLSRLIGMLIQRGLVTRTRPQSNGRIVEISLSPEGRKLVEQVIPIAARFEEAALMHLGGSEIKLIKSALEQAHGNLDALEQELRSGGQLAKAAEAIARKAPTAKRTRKRE